MRPTSPRARRARCSAAWPAAFVVSTTLDRRLQLLAERTLRASLEREGDALGAHQAALVALAPDGAVLAMAGGRDYAESQFNRVVQARRQPGSAFKLFVYLAALRAGLSPDSPVEDAPLADRGLAAAQLWGPLSRPDRPAHRVRAARSIPPRSGCRRRSGGSRSQRSPGRWGSPRRCQPHPSLALGSAEVTLLELTAAYGAVLADVGRVAPYMVRAVRAPGDAAFQRRRPAPPPASWPRPQIMELLLAAVESGTGRAARLDVPVFGKTGTTQDHRDAWFIGFAEDLVVGVWVGNDDNAPMRGVTGGGLPARIWQSFVADALQPAAAADLVADAGAASRPALTAEVVSGMPTVIDTATLRIAGGIVTLAGVTGAGGSHARDLADYIGEREVLCRRAIDQRYRCELDGWDLAEIVLLNGGGRVAPQAAADLQEAQRKARGEGRGVWATPVLIRGY